MFALFMDDMTRRADALRRDEERMKVANKHFLDKLTDLEMKLLKGRDMTIQAYVDDQVLAEDTMQKLKASDKLWTQLLDLAGITENPDKGMFMGIEGDDEYKYLGTLITHKI